MGKIMVKNESEYPYMFCSECRKLSPIVITKGKKSCGMCGNASIDKDGLPVVTLTKSEALLRKLPILDEED